MHFTRCCAPTRRSHRPPNSPSPLHPSPPPSPPTPPRCPLPPTRFVSDRLRVVSLGRLRETTVSGRLRDSSLPPAPPCRPRRHLPPPPPPPPRPLALSWHAARAWVGRLGGRQQVTILPVRRARNLFYGLVTCCLARKARNLLSEPSGRGGSAGGGGGVGEGLYPIPPTLSPTRSTLNPHPQPSHLNPDL